ncbi:hypothetical protein DV736_g711, partial [Chaetothyriales sp. CBS 134916]
MDYEAEDVSDISILTAESESVIPSSPLSSIRSISPPPGFRAFTPPLSQDAGDDLMQRARKRRKLEPRTRTTRHLDLTSDTAQSDYDRSESLDLMFKALRNRRKIIVVAGAGISVSAGIPDFRSSQGLFKRLKGEHKLKGSGKELFDASVYKDDSSTSSFHDMVRKLSSLASDAKPTLFHRLLARLSSEGRLLRLYTQNVDGLESHLPPLKTQVPLNHKAPWPQTIQLHGGLEKMICQKCRHVSAFEPHLFDGPVPPSCPECIAHDLARTEHAGKRSHGIGKLRPRMVLYNEHNPDEDAIGAVTTADFRTRPDAVIVVGTSMKIPAVRRIVHEMCRIVRDRREGSTIWINRDAPPAGKDLENLWDLVVKGDSDEVARLANMGEWDDWVPVIAEDFTESDVERIRSSQGDVSVEITTPKKKPAFANLDLGSAAMTPPLSPKYKNIDVKDESSCPPRLKLNVAGAKAKKSGLGLKNPASEGRKLSEVIRKGTKPQFKSKTTLHKQARIMGKVSKPVVQQQMSLPGKAKQPHELLSPRQNMSVISVPLKAQNMYSTPTLSSAEGSPMPATPPGMMRQTPPESGFRTLAPATPPSMQEQPEQQWEQTVSPNGNVPRDMERLLN